MEQILALNYLPPFHFLLNPSLIFLVAASLLALALALSLSLSPTKQKVAWPPSPPSLPLLGNLHQLGKGGNILSSLTAMAKTYGPVMTVWMGPSPIVILTGQTPIWEALVNQASNFSSRPLLYSRQFTNASYKTMLSSPYNQYWTKLRRILHNNVLSPAHVALQSSSHQASVKKLITKLEKEMKEKNGVVKPFYVLKMMAMNFIAPLCFGPDFEDDDFLSQLEEFIARDIFLSNRGDMLLDQFPAARYFVPSTIETERNWKSLRADILRFMLPFIRFARSYRDYLRRTAPSSFLNCLLSVGEEEEAEMGEKNSKLTDEEIAFNLYELFLLAVDSTSTAIEWALAYLITNPHVQERAYEEIVQEGKDGLFSLEDLKKLPYIQSVVKETLRKESIDPLAMLHQTEEECKVMGITIPAKAGVLFNLHSVANDPEVWKEPDVFRPERFMEKKEMENVRMAYLPFGAGRRVCAGMEVTSLHVPITLANLLKTFKWDSAKEGILPDLTRDIPTVLMAMKYHLEARITPRPS